MDKIEQVSRQLPVTFIYLVSLFAFASDVPKFETLLNCVEFANKLGDLQYKYLKVLRACKVPNADLVRFF